MQRSRVVAEGGEQPARLRERGRRAVEGGAEAGSGAVVRRTAAGEKSPDVAACLRVERAEHRVELDGRREAGHGQHGAITQRGSGRGAATQVEVAIGELDRAAE